VIVTSKGVSSNPFSITATATLPSVYAIPNTDGSAFFVTAALQGTGFLVGTTTVDSRVARAAQPGDILDLYMIGLGKTTDASKFVTDRLFSGAFPVSLQVTATVGGKDAPVLFAGLTSPGLYLVRMVVPKDLPAAPQVLQIVADGVRTRPNLILTVGAIP
jgi:uncharacterized protein (TIGR03437 family)